MVPRLTAYLGLLNNVVSAFQRTL